MPVILVTTSTHNATERLHRCAIESVAQLATSASNLTSGPATELTLIRALHSLSTSAPRQHGQSPLVYAMVSPFLAAIMRATPAFAQVEIIEVFPQITGPTTESGMLFVAGALFWELGPIKTTVRKVPLRGWRRWLMPWSKRRTETMMEAALTCCIVEQHKVQALETPYNSTYNTLAILAQCAAVRPPV